MKMVHAVGSFLCISMLASAGEAKLEPLDLVNMYIGTDGKHKTEYGGTMPVVGPPFAMTSWTAQTRQNKISATSYHYRDTSITGFIGTHQSAIWMGDFGFVTIIPGVDTVKTSPDARQMPFQHADEITTPYYYAVKMDAGTSRTVQAEMTATERCVIMRFTFPKNACSSIVVEATRPKISGFAAVSADTMEITGYNPQRMDAHLSTIKLPNFKGYFVVQINKKFSGAGTFVNGELKPDQSAAGANAGAYAQFSTTDNEVVQVKVGTSFISIEQARDNLQQEIPDWDFTAVKNQSKETWRQKLSLFSVAGGTKDQRVQFYTALYHAMLYPRLFSEHGRYYSAFDDQTHPGVSYTAFSLWDIFRAEFSLLTLTCPEHINGMIQALLQNYQEGGWMPKWPNPSYTSIMLGTHADSLVAEAINKGFKGFDYQLAYAAVYKDAMTPPTNDTKNRWRDRACGQPYSAREGLTYYKELGYVPADKTDRATSCTLEGAYDDWCVAQVARAVGKLDDYQLFIARSKNYKNVFNQATGLMAGRNADGTWAPNGNFFTEGGQQQNSFTVFHDIPGLVQLMGGVVPFNQALDNSHPDMSNEPGQHMPYLYNYSGKAATAQRMVRQGLLHPGYANAPAGLPGNDDCGQVSAWWLFSSMGFYPVNPASGDYMIGSPLFDQVSLRLANGKTFTVTAAGNSPKNVYIQAATLNGASLTVPFITWAQIQAGGKLHFVMGPEPSAWAAGWQPHPGQQ